MSQSSEDAHLVRQALAGGPEGEEAFRSLVARYLGMVRAYVWQKLGDAEAARDIAQEALAEAFRALRDLREPEKFGAWVRGIATRKCIYWIRGERRERAVLELAAREAQERERLAGPEERAAKEFERDELRSAVRRAIMELPEKYRVVVVLKHFDNRSYEDIAALLGLSEAAVDKRLTRARVMLKQRLKGFGGGS